MSNEGKRVDKPEPRWQAALAFVAVGTIYLALPKNLIVGPAWLVAYFNCACCSCRQSLVIGSVNFRSIVILGFLISSLITLALIGSVILLVTTLPSHKEPPLKLLFSAAMLWLTNVIVFALWYWRIDGGGPTQRQDHYEFGSHSFLFPQMQIPHDERGQFGCMRWRPHFIDLSFHRVHAKLDLRPDGCAVARALGQGAGDDSGFHFAVDCRATDFARCRCVVENQREIFTRTRPVVPCVGHESARPSVVRIKVLFVAPDHLEFFPRSLLPTKLIIEISSPR